jgi:hypothetical protein
VRPTIAETDYLVVGVSSSHVEVSLIEQIQSNNDLVE